MSTVAPPSQAEAPAQAELRAPAVQLPLDRQPAAGRHESTARLELAVAIPALTAAVIAGGIFNGWEPRVLAPLAALIGLGVASLLARVRGSAPAIGLALVGVGVAGALLALIAGGPAGVATLGKEVPQAVQEARLLRPPIDLDPGFAAMLGWLCAAFGFAAVWIATVVRRPALGIIFALPVAGIAAISMQADRVEQLVSGIALVLAFAIALGVLSGARAGGDEELPLAFEIRRGLKALPLLVMVTAGLLALSQSNFLFPRPLIDPQLEAQKPHSVPLTDVQDKILFTVSNTGLTGPWVVGTLDVYDGTDWRLPPIAAAHLKDIPVDGIVDRTLKPANQATFTVRQLGGAVLPSLPNTVAIAASGPTLAYDGRAGSIRLVQGQIEPGFSYQVAGAGVPKVEDLEKLNGKLPAYMDAYTWMPPAPPGIQILLSNSPTSSRWQRFDHLRRLVLDQITASGAGSPVSVTADRADQILTSTKEATPFELVALQVMLARWAGVPARIGYGFDGGTKVSGHLEVHPRDGAAFPEVWFPNHGWLPVIGFPTKAKPSATTNPALLQFHAGTAPSNDISVPLFLPFALPPQVQLYELVRGPLLLTILLLAIGFGVYLLAPVLLKGVARARRRSRAQAAGPRARVVCAYAEWRDTLADFGHAFATDTPLMLLRHFGDDEEHTELAWLVTRALWGDLQTTLNNQHAHDAEELSRTLQRRFRTAMPITNRLAATLSRNTLRQPYYPGGIEIEEAEGVA